MFAVVAIAVVGFVAGRLPTLNSFSTMVHGLAGSSIV